MTIPIHGRVPLPIATGATIEQQHANQTLHSLTKSPPSPVGWSRKLYRNLTNLVEQWVTQLLPKNTHTPKPLVTEKGLIGFKVNGIADRLPRALDPWNPIPNHDLILLGMADDYPQRVVSITIGGDTTPISYENGQVVARHLNFGDLRFLNGHLTLANGTKLILQIQIIKAL